MSAHEVISVARREGEEAAASVVLPDVRMKDCPRCNHDVFDVVGGKKTFVRRQNGQGRYSDGRVQGVCFKCGGAGKVPATRAEKKKVDQADAEKDLIRLRAMYRVVRRGLREAEVALEGEDCFRNRKAVTVLSRELELIEAAGKGAAAKIR